MVHGSSVSSITQTSSPAFASPASRTTAKIPSRGMTVSGLPADSAVGVTFLADLRHLTQCGADPESRSHLEDGQLYSFTENVFRKSPRNQRERDLLLQTVHAFLCQQTKLPVPIAGMCVTHNVVVRKELDPLDRMLLLPFSLFCSKNTKSNLYLFNASRLWYN